MAEFILLLLDEGDDWTLAQLVLTQQLPDDSDWSAFAGRIGFDPDSQLKDYPPVLWRVLARLQREDYEWACQQIAGAAQEQKQDIPQVITAIHDRLMYEVQRNPKLELDRAGFEWLLKKVVIYP